mgnify:CR=1 FL=1|tara:strand:- start:293 stop:454 length:162 start_codon:yes stop_codon:yes gene_type:complete
MNLELSLKDILTAIRKWSIEAKNPRNDGWVQKGYEDKIKRIFYETGKILNENK